MDTSYSTVIDMKKIIFFFLSMLMLRVIYRPVLPPLLITAMVLLHMLMGINMWGNLKMAKEMGKEPIHGLMGINTWGNL
jgi:hypothetical protein